MAAFHLQHVALAHGAGVAGEAGLLEHLINRRPEAGEQMCLGSHFIFVP